jgi:hypothetical protein
VPGAKVRIVNNAWEALSMSFAKPIIVTVEESPEEIAEREWLFGPHESRVFHSVSLLP